MPRFGGREETMTSGMMAFAIAVGATSLVCYLLMTRAENIRRNRRRSGDGGAPDVASCFSGDAWTLSSWFGGGHSAFEGGHSALDSSGNPIDSSGSFSGGGDSGGSGGGDGGGGGGGGDGGGGGSD
jgi:hypothetical protein